jgi:hypothetical protein
MVVLAGTSGPPGITVTPSSVVMVVVPFPSVTMLEMGTVSTWETVYDPSTWVAYQVLGGGSSAEAGREI